MKARGPTGSLWSRRGDPIPITVKLLPQLREALKVVNLNPDAAFPFLWNESKHSQPFDTNAIAVVITTVVQQTHFPLD